MRKTKTEKSAVPSRYARIGLVLILTMIAGFLAPGGLLGPQDAQAAVAAGTDFSATNVAAGSASALTAISGSFTVGAGTNRLLVVVAQFEAAANTDIATFTTGTWGGQSLTSLTLNGSGTIRNRIWIGYMKETQIAAASGTTLNLNIATSANPSAYVVKAAWFSGVDQTTSINHFVNGGSDTGASPHNFGATALNVVSGGLAYYFETTNAGVTYTPPAGWTENYDGNDASANFALTCADAVISSTTTTNPNVTQSAATRYAISAISLNPVAAGGTQTLDTFTDNSTNITVPATDLTMATIASTAGSGGAALSATNVSIGGTVALADVTSIKVFWGAVQVGSIVPAALTNQSITLTGAGSATGNLSYKISLAATAAGKTFSLTVNSVTGSTGGAVTLPRSTTARTASAGATQTLDSFTDNSANATVPATDLTMATIASTAGSGGAALTATSVSFGGTVALADITNIKVFWGAVQVASIAPSTLTNQSITLTGAGSATGNLVYKISLAGTAAGKTFLLTVNSVTGSTGGALTLPRSTAGRTATAGASDPSKIIACSGCHGNPPVDGTARNQPAGQFPGSHSIHAGTTPPQHSYACTNCHPNNTAYDHRTGYVNMSFATGSYSKTGATTSFAQSNSTPFVGGTCSNTACHGGNSGTWGTPSTDYVCVKCHGVAGTTLTSWNTSSPLRAAPGYVATTAPTGTGVNTAGTTGTITSNVSNNSKVGAHNSHLKALSGYSDPIACTECHQVPTTVPDGAAPNHMNGGTNLSWGSLASNAGATPAYSGGRCSNVYCHGATLADGTIATKTTPSWVVSLLTGSATNDCGKCHGYPPSTPSDHNGKGPTDCHTCHTHVNSLGTGFTVTGVSLHINGQVEGGSCLGCHDTGGSGAQGTRVAVVSQFSASSHHVQGTAISNAHCYNCHWEATISGQTTTYHPSAAGNPVQLVVWTSTSRPASYILGSTAVLYTSNTGSRGDLQNINTHCLGCHSNTNAMTAPFSGDTNTTARYAWDGSSVASRYSSPTTTVWGKYSGANVVAKNQVKAYSAHGNAANNARGWNTTETYPNTSGTVNVLCFDCHNSHGSTAGAPSDRTTSYVSAASGTNRGGNLKSTTSGSGGYSATYTPTASAGTGTWQPYDPGAALCFDCHLVSAASTTVPWGYNSTFGATQGVLSYEERPYWGGSPAGTASTGNSGRQQRTPYKNTRGNTRGGHFKASSTLTNAAMGTINGICTPCHDPHGISATNVGVCSLAGFVTRATCTTAGGTWTATPQYGLPLLKGTWVTSPYKEDLAPATTNTVKGGGRDFRGFSNGSIPGRHIDQNTFSMATDTIHSGTYTLYNLTTAPVTSKITQTAEVFGGLCLQCHTQANLVSVPTQTDAWTSYKRIHNTVKGWARSVGSNANNKTHAYTCSKCHAPHSSQHPRLAITNCLDTNHRGRVASGGTTPVQNSTVSSSGAGNGRFPGGGGGFGCSSSVKWKTTTSDGGYYFGTAGTSRTAANGQFVICHDGPGANNGTFTNQRWNSKTPW
jgi:predicted CxxxxCH...CXXCH cytochrome family protein